MRYDLITIIKELMFRHDCVIIPGFGGFILNYVPAVIEKSTGMFHPPARRVSFNRNLTHNDGLLIGSVSNTFGINYGEARDIVDRFTAELKKVLTRGDEAEFEHIGVFRTNQEGGIQFEPDRDANYNLGSYGMESFRYEPVAGYDVRKRVIKAGRQVSPAGIPVRKLLIRAAVAIPVLIALVAVPLRTDILGTRLEKTSLNPLAETQLESNRQAIDEMPVVTGDVEADTGQPASLTTSEDIVTETITASSENTAASEPADVTAVITGQTEVPSETLSDAEAEEYSFFIIAGSFKSAENAKVMATRLRAMGYEPQIMDAPDNFTRVAAKGFTDLSSATAERNKLAETIEGLWILRK